MKKNRETIAPVIVDSGPVKEVIVRGKDIDQTEFPVPKWHYLEGGRYIHTFSSIVTKDPDTGVTNVGMYRGMIGHKDTAPFLLVKGGQHWGAHFVKWAARGKPMPVACVIGWDPIMSFLSGSPLPSGVCEYDVMGGYRGEPAQLVRCETVDLEVPASAEIVIEGTISDDPSTYEMEGPFGEYTGYVSDLPTPRPTMKVTCITHRRDPIFCGSLEGTLPGSYSENSVMSSVQRAAIAWNILNGAGIPGILDVYAPPITNGVNIRIQIKKHYQGQPKQIAAALWGNAAAQYRYKHVIVVEEDIDPAADEQVEWAYAHRVNAGEGGIVIFPGIFGSPIDPVDAVGRSQRRTARHRTVEPRADRRHALVETSAAGALEQRTLSADRQAASRRRGAGRCALGGIRARRFVGFSCGLPSNPAAPAPSPIHRDRRRRRMRCRGQHLPL